MLSNVKEPYMVNLREIKELHVSVRYNDLVDKLILKRKDFVSNF